MKGLGLGGAERLLATSAPLIDSGRFELDVAYVLPWKDALVPELRDRGVSVTCVGEGTGGRLRWAARLASLIRRGSYDLVHTHAPVPASVARLVPGPRFVHTEHNTWGRYRTPTRIANAVTYHRNARVIAVSSGVAESISPPGRRPGPPVEVIHHGVDLSAVRSGPAARRTARATLGEDEQRPLIGTVANMTPKKDQATLLRAMRRVVHDIPDARLLIIGTGPLQPELESLAQKSLPSGAVRFLGMRTDVQEILPALDVFTLTSLHEGLSIAMLEAMAAGVPVVATRVGGIPEALRDGVEGLLVPSKDADAIAAAYLTLLADEGLRREMGARGQERSAVFSVEAAVLRTQEIYDEVFDG